MRRSMQRLILESDNCKYEIYYSNNGLNYAKLLEVHTNFNGYAVNPHAEVDVKILTIKIQKMIMLTSLPWMSWNNLTKSRELI